MANLSAILSGVNRLRNGATGASVAYPVLAGPVTVTSGTSAWGLGAWSQIVAANTIGTVALTGAWCNVAAPATNYQIEIGAGGAGSEVVVHRFIADRKQVTAVGVSDRYTSWFAVPVQLTIDARLAVRTADDGGSNTIDIKLLVTPRPF